MAGEEGGKRRAPRQQLRTPRRLRRHEIRCRQRELQPAGTATRGGEALLEDAAKKNAEHRDVSAKLLNIRARFKEKVASRTKRPSAK